LYIKDIICKINPSTVYDYPKRIDKVCERENLTWEESAKDIEKIVIQYDVTGCNEQFGRQSHGAVINALKRFQEFKSVWWIRS
jgi:hypothetical protein